MHLYVYYEVPHAVRDDVLRLVRMVQRELATETGIEGRMLKRVENPGPRETWMEIYEDVAEDFESLLSDNIEAHGIDALLCGARHVERFGDVA
jgi:Domain of unknown function (DUF4936)